MWVWQSGDIPRSTNVSVSYCRRSGNLPSQPDLKWRSPAVHPFSPLAICPALARPSRAQDNLQALRTSEDRDWRSFDPHGEEVTIIHELVDLRETSASIVSLQGRTYVVRSRSQVQLQFERARTFFARIEPHQTTSQPITGYVENLIVRSIPDIDDARQVLSGSARAHSQSSTEILSPARN